MRRSFITFPEIPRLPSIWRQGAVTAPTGTHHADSSLPPTVMSSTSHGDIGLPGRNLGRPPVDQWCDCTSCGPKAGTTSNQYCPLPYGGQHSGNWLSSWGRQSQHRRPGTCSSWHRTLYVLSHYRLTRILTLIDENVDIHARENLKCLIHCIITWELLLV